MIAFKSVSRSPQAQVEKCRWTAIATKVQFAQDAGRMEDRAGRWGFVVIVRQLIVCWSLFNLHIDSAWHWKFESLWCRRGDSRKSALIIATNWVRLNFEQSFRTGIISRYILWLSPFTQDGPFVYTTATCLKRRKRLSKRSEGGLTLRHSAAGSTQGTSWELYLM